MTRGLVRGGLAVALLLVSGCGSTGDRIADTADPCVFMLSFGTRCFPAGKTAICHRPLPVMARNTAPECAR